MTEKSINFGGGSVSDTDYRFRTFLLPSLLQNRTFKEIDWHFLYSHRLLFTKLGKMSDADEGVNPLSVV